MKLSRGKITRIKNAKNQSRINMKKITKLGGSKSRYVKGGARKRIYTNVKKRRAFNLRTKTIKMRQKGGAAGESRDAADSPSGLPGRWRRAGRVRNRGCRRDVRDQQTNCLKQPVRRGGRQAGRGSGRAC